jgi:hypothetical protein
MKGEQMSPDDLGNLTERCGDVPQAPMPTPSDLSKVERSCLCYMECCAVDGGGMVESIRMNAADFAAIERFKTMGLLSFGRVPGKLLGTGPKKTWTHWVELTERGWALAGLCRRLRSDQHGPWATEVFAILQERRRQSQKT